MAKTRTKSVLDDPRFEKQCVWKDRGEQCQMYGCMSPSVAGGPWYCRSHFAQLMGWPSWQAAVTDEPMNEVDKRVNKLVPRLEGESEHDWSMRCRNWTLDRLKRGRILKLLREPGEDETEMA